jgi:hypothetical protein
MICKDCHQYFEKPFLDSCGEEWRGTHPRRFEVSPCCLTDFWESVGDAAMAIVRDELGDQDV